jgi:hypothetical protein
MVKNERKDDITQEELSNNETRRDVVLSKYFKGKNDNWKVVYNLSEYSGLDKKLNKLTGSDMCCTRNNCQVYRRGTK